MDHFGFFGVIIVSCKITKFRHDFDQDQDEVEIVIRNKKKIRRKGKSIREHRRKNQKTKW